jgi:hypothetical protein
MKLLNSSPMAGCEAAEAAAAAAAADWVVL